MESRYQYTPYITPLLIVAAISALLSASAWRWRKKPGATSFALLTLALVQWSLCYCMELASVYLPEKVFWVNLQYIGITAVPAFWFTFALEYTGQQTWLTPRKFALLALQPFIVQLVAWTDGWHHLFRTSVRIDTTGRFPALLVVFGPAFWLHGIYSYALLLIGTGILFRAYLAAEGLYRRQFRILLLASLVPWVANAIFLAGYSPFPNLDLTPFAFTITTLAMSWGVLRFRLFDVVPVARAAVIEGMRDGVVVLDVQQRVVDINPAARAITGYISGDVVGTPAQQIFARWPDLMARYQTVLEAQDEIALDEGFDEAVYDLRISPLYDAQHLLAGRLIVLRDITDRKRAEVEREHLIAELDAFAHTVAHDLKNPLTMIVAATKLLERRERAQLTGDSLLLLGNITRGAYKMNSIIDELLLLASVRRAAGLPLAVLDMGVIVQEALHRLDYLIQERQAEMVLPQSWPAACGYPAWIEEVWVNYLSNAIKYGGTPLRVELGYTILGDGSLIESPHAAEALYQNLHAKIHNPQSRIAFWVRDNGAGLTPAQQQRLFTPFTRLSQARIEGHGLGLSIVQRILERLGEQVGVASVLGSGSTFWFTLPVAPEA